MEYVFQTVYIILGDCQNYATVAKLFNGAFHDSKYFETIYSETTLPNCFFKVKTDYSYLPEFHRDFIDLGR